ncbi:MAG: mechanosensitive ion channel [Dehalococcoidales bacterium]|nr:mechanosensitive ion channel [Dehalococcoidales bacterium]
MVTREGDRNRRLPGVGYLFFSLLVIAGLVTLAAFTLGIREDTAFGFLAPYRQYLVAVEFVALGVLAIEMVGRWLHRLALLRMRPDSAAAVRIIVRIVAYGVLLSAVVSILTANIAAALTTGAFAGMVAGLGTQTVIGNAVAGIFVALYRPIRIDDDVTIVGNTGRVSNITLMHTVLSTVDGEILIPSAQIISTVLVRHKQTGAGQS